MANISRTAVFWVCFSFLLMSMVACEAKHTRPPTVDPADTVQVEAGGLSVEAPAETETVELRNDPVAQEFLARLQDAMRPVRDTLRLEFDRIRQLTGAGPRDSAILDLRSRWGRVQEVPLQELLDQSAFTSRMWIDSLKRADTAFERQVRQILGSGGKYLEYNEGFSSEADLGARADLVDSVASPALAERLRMEHLESFTGVYNDAGIIAPLDTLVGRIQGWEAFARRYAGTPSAAWAESVRKGYLYSLLCGATNTSAFDNGVPGEEFVRAWKRLAAGPDGASRSLVREWLRILDAENGRLTPKARKWLGERGFDPVDMTSEEA